MFLLAWPLQCTMCLLDRVFSAFPLGIFPGRLNFTLESGKKNHRVRKIEEEETRRVKWDLIIVLHLPSTWVVRSLSGWKKGKKHTQNGKSAGKETFHARHAWFWFDTWLVESFKSKSFLYQYTSKSRSLVKLNFVEKSPENCSVVFCLWCGFELSYSINFIKISSSTVCDKVYVSQNLSDLTCFVF